MNHSWHSWSVDQANWRWWNWPLVA